jgi:hypothetical protein
VKSPSFVFPISVDAHGLRKFSLKIFKWVENCEIIFIEDQFSSVRAR